MTDQEKTQQKRLLSRAVAKALTQVGVSEEPKGSNAGPEVAQYLMSVGLNVGNPWCMAFVYWVFKVAALDLGLANPLIRTGGVMDHWRKASKTPWKQITAAAARKNPDLIQPGMIMILLIAPKTGAGHTGIVINYDKKSGLIETCEGNSNENGSRDGTVVALQNKRRLTDKVLVGFIDYSTKTS